MTELYDRIMEWGAHVWISRDKEYCKLGDATMTEVDFDECRNILEDIASGRTTLKRVAGYKVSNDKIHYAVELYRDCCNYYILEEKAVKGEWLSVSLIPYDDACRALIQYNIDLAHIEHVMERLSLPREEFERLWRARADLSRCGEEVDRVFKALAPVALLDSMAYRALKWLRPDLLGDRLIEEVIKAYKGQAPA